MARTVLGGQSVQGLDYAYTLQGWLKGVNGTSLKPGYDMGGDGLSSGANQYTAKDAFSFSLNYHAGDYQAIVGTTIFPGSSAYMGSGYKPLYNGNISSMAVNIGVFNTPILYGYTYDQLNRITGMDVYTGLNEGANSWSPLTLSTNYKERVRYDANGNIMGYLRNGTTASSQPLAMDSLNYEYISGTNQLVRVRDNVASGNYASDIDDQPLQNYAYDPIGNLVKDSLEGILRIDWTVYGKIKTVYKQNDTTINYRYDASGNRISKTVVPGAGTPRTTWYVRDASGNVMAVYNDSADRMLLKEQHLYGSSRLGIRERLGILVGTGEQGNSYSNIGVVRGEKRYELSNHLGNVLVTISDRKYGVDTSGDGDADRYVADVMSAQDYYPFGMQMPERSLSFNSYRFGFNGKEVDKAISSDAYDFGARIFDPRVGKWLSVDPLQVKYPGLSPYNFCANTPLAAKDPDGRLIIFINGMWGGPMGPGPNEKYWPDWWVRGVQERIEGKGSKAPMFYDGALGGAKQLLVGEGKDYPVDAATRIAAGQSAGYKDAATIIGKLDKGETIKIVTNSMGAAFERGFTKGLLQYQAEENAKRETFNAQIDNMLAPLYAEKQSMQAFQKSITEGPFAAGQKKRIGRQLHIINRRINDLQAQKKELLNVQIEMVVDLSSHQVDYPDPNSNTNYYMMANQLNTAEKMFVQEKRVGGAVQLGVNPDGSSRMKGHHGSWALPSDMPEGKDKKKGP